MSTQGVGTFAINSFWESGRLIFYEKAYGHTTTGNVFIVGADYVQVGDTANDVNFVWDGSSTGTFTLDAGAHTLAMTGLATSTDGAVTITNATATSSTTTGALIVTGGIATAADITCGDDLFMSNGGVINFNASNVTITHSAGVLTLAGALTVGASGTGYDVTLYGDTAGCTLLYDQSEDQLVVTQTNAATSGVERTLDISQTHTGIGASAEALRAVITTDTKGGTYMNALFGKIDFATTGLVTGLAGVICAELTMPGGAVAGGAGTYATFESEINLPTSYAGTVPISVMYISTWGDQKADFDTYGYLFDINGVASGSGKFWYDATNGTTDDWIRCRVNGVVKYLMLSDVQTEA